MLAETLNDHILIEITTHLSTPVNTCEHLVQPNIQSITQTVADWQIHKIVKLSYVWHYCNYESDNYRTPGDTGAKTPSELSRLLKLLGWDWRAIALATHVICKSDQQEQLRSSARVSSLREESCVAAKKQQPQNHLVSARKSLEQSQHPNRATAFKCALVRLICATVVLRYQWR